MAISDITRCIAGCGVPYEVQSRLHAASVFPSIFHTTAPLTAKVVSEFTVSILKQCDEQLGEIMAKNLSTYQRPAFGGKPLKRDSMLIRSEGPLGELTFSI